MGGGAGAVQVRWGVVMVGEQRVGCRDSDVLCVWRSAA